MNLVNFKLDLTRGWSVRARLDSSLRRANSELTLRFFEVVRPGKSIKTIVNPGNLSSSTCSSVQEPGMFSKNLNLAFTTVCCMVIYWFFGFRKPDNHDRESWCQFTDEDSLLRVLEEKGRKRKWIELVPTIFPSKNGCISTESSESALLAEFKCRLVTRLVPSAFWILETGWSPGLF